MSNTKHTPGPWVIRKTDLNNVHVNTIRSESEDRAVYALNVGISDANARLIAAAPEMAEALRAVVTAIMHTPRSQMDASAWKALAEQAAVALAKAGAL